MRNTRRSAWDVLVLVIVWAIVIQIAVTTIAAYAPYLIGGAVLAGIGFLVYRKATRL